jgi:sirohydrochlorin cobaltochelatase
LDAILLFSHGSVMCGAERNLLELAARMRERGDAAIVEVGFLNYTDPTFTDAVASCVRQGAKRIVIAPYFLVDGKFVVKDLPGEIEAARSAHPQIEFVVAAVIGFHEVLADAVLEAASGAPPSVAEAAELCREHPKCPLYGAPPCRVLVENAS